MVRELAAERALDNGFLESADRRLELLVRDRSLPDKLVENLGRDRRRSFRRLAFRFAVHRHSSCYAPHTKFLTPSPALQPPPFILPSFPPSSFDPSILQSLNSCLPAPCLPAFPFYFSIVAFLT